MKLPKEEQGCYLEKLFLNINIFLPMLQVRNAYKKVAELFGKVNHFNQN